jgi:uncharacterized protein (TIGR02271 family)
MSLLLNTIKPWKHFCIFQSFLSTKDSIYILKLLRIACVLGVTNANRFCPASRERHSTDIPRRMENTGNYAASPNSEPQPFADQRSGEPSVIPVIEEQLRIGKKVVESGKVRISKRVSEEKVTVNVPVIHEEVDIERVEVNQFVDTAPEIRYEGETMIIPVLKEVVEVRLMLVEELRVTRKKVESVDSQQVVLRREEVTVDRDSTANE